MESMSWVRHTSHCLENRTLVTIYGQNRGVSHVTTSSIVNLKSNLAHLQPHFYSQISTFANTEWDKHTYITFLYIKIHFAVTLLLALVNNAKTSTQCRGWTPGRAPPNRKQLHHLSI